MAGSAASAPTSRSKRKYDASSARQECELMAQNPSFDTVKSAAFADGLLDTLNRGALCLMISVGHRTGLFDTMRDLAPSTSAEIAASAGLNERYVREWLGAMVTGRVSTSIRAANDFPCPQNMRRYLTRAAGADNIGLFGQYIAVLGQCRGRYRRVFQKRRRRALWQVPALSRSDGRGQRPIGVVVP